MSNLGHDYRRRAFTIVEVLCVFGIILLIAALLFPVFVKARERSKQPVCIAQMRQLGMAMLMYMDQAEGIPRVNTLDFLVEQRLATDKRLLLCPSDAFNGLWKTHLECKGYRVGLPQSYYSPFSKVTHFWERLVKEDPNAGILACRSHGRRAEFHAAHNNPAAFCSNVSYLYEGPILRLRLDGSVKEAPFDLSPTGYPGSDMVFRFWRLFTDVPIDWDRPNP